MALYHVHSWTLKLADFSLRGSNTGVQTLVLLLSSLHSHAGPNSVSLSRGLNSPSYQSVPSGTEIKNSRRFIPKYPGSDAKYIDSFDFTKNKRTLHDGFLFSNSQSFSQSPGTQEVAKSRFSNSVGSRTPISDCLLSSRSAGVTVLFSAFPPAGDGISY